MCALTPPCPCCESQHRPDSCRCLCLHTVEFQKLRALLKPAHRVLPIVQKAIRSKAVPGSDANDIDAEALQHIVQLTGHQGLAGVRLLWPDRVCEVLVEALVHHGDYSVFVSAGFGEHLHAAMCLQ